MAKGLKYYLVRDKQNFGPYSKKELAQYVDDRRVSLAELCQEAVAGGALHRVGNVLEDQKKYEDHHLAGGKDEVNWEYRDHEVIGEEEERTFDDEALSPDTWERPGASPLARTFSGTTVPNLSRAEAIRAAKDSEKTAKNTHLFYRGHPSLWHYTPHFFWTLFWLSSGFSLWHLSPVWPFLGSLIATVYLSFTALEYDRRCYLIDHRRVEITEGIFNRTTREILTKDIRDTRVVRRGLFQSMFNLGDVIFNSAMGKNALQFKAVKNPHKIKEIIRKIQEEQASQAKRPEHVTDFYGLQKNGE